MKIIKIIDRIEDVILDKFLLEKKSFRAGKRRNPNKIESNGVSVGRFKHKSCCVFSNR